MEYRSEWTYRRYLAESCKGMLTSWTRVSHHWDEIRDGISAILCAVILIGLPLLLPLAPLFAWLAMASERRNVRRAKEEIERMRNDRFGKLRKEPQ